MLRHLRVVTARVVASGSQSGEIAEWVTKWPSEPPSGRAVFLRSFVGTLILLCNCAKGHSSRSTSAKKEKCFRSHFGSSLAGPLQIVELCLALRPDANPIRPQWDTMPGLSTRKTRHGPPIRGERRSLVLQALLQGE